MVDRWARLKNRKERIDHPSQADHVSVRRIARLFERYKLRLALVLGLVFVSSALGAVPAFLIRDVFDVALPQRNLLLLDALVGGMIAIAVLNALLGVVQTFLANQVGQRVMHDLRIAVFDHLRKLSFAFFTRTTTGEIQLRLANDIGGVRDVLTSTATNVLSSTTTMAATVVAMFILDWRLTVLALALLPLFVWLTKSGRRAAQTTR